MAKYLMSEKTANFIRQQMANDALNTNGADGETRRKRNSFYVPDVFAHPFEVKWGASVGNGTNEDGTAKESGSWIIWLPGGSLQISGSEISVVDRLSSAGEPYPGGWYKIDEELLSKKSGGKLYLVVESGDATVSGDSTDVPIAYFAAASVVAQDSMFSILIAEAKVDEASGAKTVKQSVDSAIVLAGGKGDCMCVKQHPDGISLSNEMKGNESEGAASSNYWSVKGFGKFTAGGNELGTFEEATEMDLGGTAADSCAFICRIGESSAADGNSIAYRKLKLGSSTITPSAFQYVEETTKDGELDVTVRKIINCTFVNGNEIVTLADFTPPDDGTVYLNLVCASANGDVAVTTGKVSTAIWKFNASLSTTKLEPKFDPGFAKTSGVQYSIPLYKFAGGKVEIDYRTSFLHVNSNIFDYGVGWGAAHFFGTDVWTKAPDSSSNGFGFYKEYVAQFLMGKLCSLDLSYNGQTGWRVLVCDTSVGVHAIKDSSGTVLAYFPSTADVTLSADGGGSSYTAGNDGIVVADNKISTNSTVTQELSVIVGVAYDSSTHQLTASKKKITITYGVITAVEDGGTEVIATAVEES